MVIVGLGLGLLVATGFLLWQELQRLRSSWRMKRRQDEQQTMRRDPQNS
jgi:hypothetical protein